MNKSVSEEVIFKGTDKHWNNKELPVTLITYEDGEMDIHRQTGWEFNNHINEARKVLAERGLKIKDGEPWQSWPTGAYCSVVKV